VGGDECPECRGDYASEIEGRRTGAVLGAKQMYRMATTLLLMLALEVCAAGFQQTPQSFQSVPTAAETQQIQASTSPAQTQPPTLVFVEGTLNKPKGAPVENATIKAITGCGRIVGFAVTNNKGHFRLAVPTGSYIILAMAGHKLIADGGAEATAQTSSVELTVGAVHVPTVACAEASPDPSAAKDVVDVFYATDRGQPPQDDRNYHGRERNDGHLELGVVTVTFPRDKSMRSNKIPTIWPVEDKPNAPNKITVDKVFPFDATPANDVIQSYKPMGLYTRLKTALSESSTDRVLVYVHGFNVSFDEGAETAAHLAYDLGFKGSVILYSWPSRHSVPMYGADEDSIWWSAPHLQDFLTGLAQQSHIGTIDLLAHSMGTRAVALALSNLLTDPSIRPKFNQVVLVAGDFDSGMFGRIACKYDLRSTHISLYASKNDKVLKLSHDINADYRIGEVGRDNVIFVWKKSESPPRARENDPELESIDATKVDTAFLGHSYYADQPRMLSELFSLFAYQQAAKNRDQFDQSFPCQQGDHWELDPHVGIKCAETNSPLVLDCNKYPDSLQKPSSGATN